MDGTAQSSKSSTLSTDDDMPSLEDADPKPKPDVVVVIVDNYIPHLKTSGNYHEPAQRETEGGPHVADDAEIQAPIILHYGGGITPDCQINDTNIHSTLRAYLRAKEKSMRRVHGQNPVHPTNRGGYEPTTPHDAPQSRTIRLQRWVDNMHRLRRLCAARDGTDILTPSSGSENEYVAVD